MKINHKGEIEEKKINNDLEIKKLEINGTYNEKIMKEELRKEMVMKSQNLESEVMKNQLKLLMGQIIINKINDLFS
jgi:hypothetical protein